MKKRFITMGAVCLAVAVIGTALMGMTSSKATFTAEEESSAEQMLQQEYSSKWEDYYQQAKQAGARDREHGALYDEAACDASERISFDIVEDAITIVGSYREYDSTVTAEAFVTDRGAYYDFIVSACNTINNHKESLSAEEYVSLKSFLDMVYLSLFGAENDPYTEDFESVKGKVADAVHAIEATITPSNGIVTGNRPDYL